MFLFVGDDPDHDLDHAFQDYSLCLTAQFVFIKS